MISYAQVSFGKHLKNRQISYQSVGGPCWLGCKQRCQALRFCGILPFFKADLRIKILMSKFWQITILLWYPIKYREFLLPLHWLYLIIGSKILYRQVCALFIGKMLHLRVKSCASESPSVLQIQHRFHRQIKLCECRNSSDYANFWPILKSIEDRRILCWKL